jgi:hypothetical protein
MRRRGWPASAILLATSLAILPHASVQAQSEGSFVQAAAGPAEPAVLFAMSKDQLAIKARGKWVERLKRGPHSPILPTNAVEIQCSRKNMSCEELRAEAGKPRDDVSLTRRSFTITEWTPQRILARSDTDSADLMLRIYPDKQRVELSYWDTKPQHERVGPADGWAWELR